MARDMKDSGIEWIGEIPREWEVSSLKHLGQFINGYAFKPEQWGFIGKRIIRIQDLTGSNDNPNYYDGDIDIKYHINNGDILVSWAATLDTFIWNKGEGLLNQHIFKAIHNEKRISYKFFYVLGNEYTSDMKKNQRLFKEKYNDKIEEILSRNEHDRWNAYTRSIGYVYVSCKEVANYYESNKHYIHYLARRHPALVEYDELDKVSKELSKITSREIDLKSSDTMIIRFIKDKIEL